MNWLQEAYEFTDIFPFLDFMDIPNGEDKYNEIKVKTNRLLKFLYDADVVQPLIFKGEIIQLEWESKSRYLEIEIHEDRYHLTYRDIQISSEYTLPTIHLKTPGQLSLEYGILYDSRVLVS